MHKLHRSLLLALVSLGVARRLRRRRRPRHSSTAPPAGSFSLTPEANSPPEFGRCIKTTGGAYTDAGCTQTAGKTGKNYEWYAAFGSAHPLEKAGFSNDAQRRLRRHAGNGQQSKVTCEGEGSTGEIHGQQNDRQQSTRRSPKCSAFGVACQAPEQPRARSSTNTTGRRARRRRTRPPNRSTTRSARTSTRSGTRGRSPNSAAAACRCRHRLDHLAGDLQRDETHDEEQNERAQRQTETGKLRRRNAEVLMAQISEGCPSEQAGETLTTIQTNEEKVEVNSVV